MGKTLKQLHEKLKGLYELKSRAEAAVSTDERRTLGGQVFDGAMELLSSTGDFSPIINSNDGEGIKRELARWKREIKLPAESLKYWCINKL